MTASVGSYPWYRDRDQAKRLLPDYGSVLTRLERDIILDYFGLEGRVALTCREIAAKRGRGGTSMSAAVRRGLRRMKQASGEVAA